MEGIIQSGHLANELGIDMLKAEFPGDVSTPAGQAAADACKRLAAGISMPWVILSAGVGYEQFRERVRIAAGAGTCGFLAGRSIWHDAASVHDPAKRAVADAAKRLDELTAITRAHGTPWQPALSGRDLVAAFPSGWYSTWHSQPAVTHAPE